MYYYAHYFGGNRNARDLFKKHQWYQDAVDFCEKYDQNCFDPDYNTEPLEFFEPLVRNMLSSPNKSDLKQTVKHGN